MMERYIAVDNVCAWPNLTKLNSGEIIATIFNQPCHGKWEGDVECWASSDGRFWEKRGVAAPHEPGTNRMNVSAGKTWNGELLVIASGWDNRPRRPEPTPILFHDEYKQPEGTGFGESNALTPWLCRSHDGGETWQRVEIKTLPDGMEENVIPFGDIIQGPEENMLAGTCYRSGKVWFMVSRDDGQNWSEYNLINEGYNETDVLHLGEGRWLAVARPVAQDGMVLFRSTDNGKTWARGIRFSLADQHPGHLLRLRDGRILMSCGMRNTGYRGVTARISEDEGKSWSGPIYLAQYDSAADGGYPSSTELDDGKIVTVYYSACTAHHQRYHMGAVIWPLNQ